MITRILLLLLCLGVLNIVNGCYFDPAPYRVSSYESSEVGAYQGEPYQRMEQEEVALPPLIVATHGLKSNCGINQTTVVALS